MDQVDWLATSTLLVIGVVVVMVAGLLIAAGVRLLERRAASDEDASRLQARLLEVIGRDPRLARLGVMLTATFADRGVATVEIVGQVPSAAARREVVRAIARESARLHRRTVVVDRLAVRGEAEGRRATR